MHSCIEDNVLQGRKNLSLLIFTITSKGKKRAEAIKLLFGRLREKNKRPWDNTLQELILK